MTSPSVAPVSVVTGAAGLIGAEICAELAQRGSRVVAIDNRAARLDVERVFRADVTDPEAIADVAASVAVTYGHLDRLVCAAALTGLHPGRGVAGELASLDLDVWRELIEVNLTGALICVQRFHDLLVRAPAPKILLVGSIQGLVPTHGTGAYGVSKVALAGLTRQLAAELAGKGVTVNMLSPGPICDQKTGEQTAAPHGVGPTPLGRFGSPSEVAGAVASLVEDAFGYLTGTVIPLDGGEHLRPRHAPTPQRPDRATAAARPAF